MPSKSKKQAKLMRVVCHSKEFADKVGIPQSVGCEFEKTDKQGKFALHKKISETVDTVDINLILI